MGFSVIRKFIF